MDNFELFSSRFTRILVRTITSNMKSINSLSSDMSTLRTIETIHTYLILDDIQPFSRYFISVSICNHFDCGPSSSTIDIQTPSLNKNSIFSFPTTTITRTIHRPSSIRTKIHYSTFDEIGLKITYPAEIVENVIIIYQLSNNSFKHQLNISPPAFNIRLTNLSCGNPYEIMIYAKNHIGSSAIEYLEVRTEGSGRIFRRQTIFLSLKISVPIFLESVDLFRTIAHDHVILNINQWIIPTCPILSYEIEYYPRENLSRIESNHYRSPIDFIRIDHLQSNTDYQLNVKVTSESGENFQGLSFRTKDSHEYFLYQHQQMIFIMVCLASFLLTFTLVFLICKKFGLSRRMKCISLRQKQFRSIQSSNNTITTSGLFESISSIVFEKFTTSSQ